MSAITPSGTVVDMQVTANFAGWILLQKDGRILATGDIGAFQSRIQPNGELKFNNDEIAFYKNNLSGGSLITSATMTQTSPDITIESARALAVDYLNGAIYILDGDGDMLFLGKNAKRNLLPKPVASDIYRDMELSPNGDQMFFLTGNGMFFTSGNTSFGASWSDLIAGDKYRDMTLVKSGSVVTQVIITDDDGKLTVVGPKDAAISNLVSLVDTKNIVPGLIRRVKLFPGYSKTIALMEGSGKMHFFSKDDSAIPTDGLIFADEAGINDDRVVQLETTNINLQSVVDSVRSILSGISKSNASLVMPYVAPDYKDKSGADAKGLQQSLQSMFAFWKVKSLSFSSSIKNPFTITNQGDTVTANVSADFVGEFPNIGVVFPTGTTGTTIQLSPSQAALIPLVSDQNMCFREIGDGRAWTIEYWQVNDLGRDAATYISQTDPTGLLDSTAIMYLTEMIPSTRLAITQPISSGPEAPVWIHGRANNADNNLKYGAILVVFRETFIWYQASVPYVTFTYFLGQSLNVPNYDTIPMKFKRQTDGSYKLVSMNLRQVMGVNENTTNLDVTQVDTTITLPAGQVTAGFTSGPFGFKFSSRGEVVTQLKGDADIYHDGTTLFAGSKYGGVMMLPENTDIFSLDPQAYIKTLNWSAVKNNQYDTVQGQDQTTDTTEGVSATLAYGRSYLVISADGKRFGFIQIPVAPTGTGTTTATDTTFQYITFDYRYEDSFILPMNF